jgi:hypothetical protein
MPATHEIDIWRAAHRLIEQHGEWAVELETNRLADIMLDRGDRDGEQMWLRVKRVIAALRPKRAHQ